MTSQKEIKKIVKSLNDQNLPADYLFPSYQKKEDERFVILVHAHNLEAAKKLFPDAPIEASN